MINVVTRPLASFATLAGAALLLAGCTAQPSAQGATPAPTAQIANLTELKTQIYEYQTSGRYARDVTAVLAQAQTHVDQRASQVTKPAIVLDIDETSLSNWPALLANDFGWIASGPCDLRVGPCGMAAWTDSAAAPAIPPTLSLFKSARAKNVAVFFITGRSEGSRAATELNLRRAGFDGWTGLAMRQPNSPTGSAADFKAPERAKIGALGFTIIANVGDQPSDLAGGYAERTFLVPNPIYRVR